MWKKDCKVFCKLLQWAYKPKVIVCIVLINITLGACASNNSTGQISKKNSEKQEYTEKECVTESEDGVIDELNGKVEISMEEAIEIGRKEANQYYDNLKLTEVHSYDNDYEPDIAAGTDGEREWWYVNFGNKDLNYVNILIQNGEVVAVENFDENGNNGLLDLEEIQLTSQEAATKAKELGLQGGNPDNENDWVSGYNFKLSYSSLLENSKDIRIFLEVIGISPNGNFAHIDFDAITGELLLKEEKIEHDDGTVEWKKFTD